MKKLVYVFAAVVMAGAFATCAQRAANVAAEEAAEGDAVNVEVVEATGIAVEGDSIVTDTVVGVIATPAE